jgi:hypothetical protein
LLQGGTVSDESDEDLIADELTMSDDDLAHISPAAIAIVLRRWSELDDETKNEIRTILKATEHMEPHEVVECINLHKQLKEFDAKASGAEPASKKPS